MEARKITVVDSTTQAVKTIMTSAETLGDLKADLRASGFNLDNMAFYEGLSKLELKHDESPLPHDIPRNGTTTNELVIRLTKAQKNIRSGAMDRKEAMAMVKKLGLADTINKKYGKNFTQCKTIDLIAEVEKAQKKAAAPAAETSKPAPKEEKKEEKKEVKAETATAAPCNTNGNNCIAITAMVKLVNILASNGKITKAQGQEVLTILNSDVEIETLESPYSKSELDSILGM